MFLELRLGRVAWYSESLRAGRSGDRIPVTTRFSAPVQIGPGAHSASCTMSTRSVPTIKRPGGGIATHRCLAPRLKKKRALPLLLFCAFLAGCRVNFTFWSYATVSFPNIPRHNVIYLFLNITSYSFFNIIIEVNKNNHDNLRKMPILVSAFRGTLVEQHFSKYSWPCSWPDGVLCRKTDVMCYFVTVSHCCGCYCILRFI